MRDPARSHSGAGNGTVASHSVTLRSLSRSPRQGVLEHRPSGASVSMEGCQGGAQRLKGGSRPFSAAPTQEVLGSLDFQHFLWDAETG